jgi:hypothetical protein
MLNGNSSNCPAMNTQNFSLDGVRRRLWLLRDHIEELQALETQGINCDPQLQWAADEMKRLEAIELELKRLKH